MHDTEPVREAAKRATRDRIVRAVADLVTDAHPAAFSVPAVAKRAGVAVATVYRYFPTKEALLDAASLVGGESSREEFGDRPTSFAELTDLLPAYWHEISTQHLGLARSQWASPAGRDLRRRRWEGKRIATHAAMTGHGIDPHSTEGRRLEAVTDVLTSSTALLELHDKAGLPVDEAAGFVLWAVDQLVAATKRTQNQQQGGR